jgi:hypothetical protein
MFKKIIGRPPCDGSHSGPSAISTAALAHSIT